jgi:hypothetical protein
MDAPITRPSNVCDMLLAGSYLYVDFPGASPVTVSVSYVDGVPVCTVLDGELEDRGLELDAREMTGRFVRVT